MQITSLHHHKGKRFNSQHSSSREEGRSKHDLEIFEEEISARGKELFIGDRSHV